MIFSFFLHVCLYIPLGFLWENEPLWDFTIPSLEVIFLDGRWNVFVGPPFNTRPMEILGKKSNDKKKEDRRLALVSGTNFECSRNVFAILGCLFALHYIFWGCWRFPFCPPTTEARALALSSRCNDLGLGMVSKAVAKVSLTAMDGHERQVDYH